MMKGERFSNIRDEIHLNGDWWCSANGEHCADVITTALNELLDKNEKKQEHIVLLENKIHRMREDIKRLEALYHYRGYIGSGDVKKEYYRMEKLLKAENNKLKKENEELKEVMQEVEHELTSVTGLSAFDKCASQLGYVEVFDEDRIDLDYSKLLKRIGEMIR